MARAMLRAPAAALTVVLAAVLAAAGAAGCSEDQTPCEAAESLQQAIDNVAEVELSDEAIGGLNGALLDLGRALEDAEEAGAPADLVDDIEQEVEDLQRSLGPAAEGETGGTVTHVVRFEASDVVRRGKAANNEDGRWRMENGFNPSSILHPLWLRLLLTPLR